ncbi:acid protease [Trametopsis cervina]|nr:acid protease [Trametopsis cervina]
MVSQRTTSLAYLFSLCLYVVADPQTIKLASRKVSRDGHGGLGRRAVGPVTLPLKEYFNGTDLQWYGDIQVGTPPQNLTVVFDTGSVTLEITSTDCTTSCASQTKFSKSLSTSFIDTSAGQSSVLTFGTGVGVDPVVGDNWQLTLRAARDTVAVGGIGVRNVSMFLIEGQTETFAGDPFDGIQGMSPSADGLFAGLVDQGLPSLFSFYITPHDVGGAELTLGAIDNSKFTGELTYASLTDPESSFWQLKSSAVIVNGAAKPAIGSSRVFLFDSGTSNMVMPAADAKAIYAQISPSIQPYTPEPGTFGLPCSQVASLPASITFVFTSQSGAPFNLTIPSSELSVGPFGGEGETCQMLINAMEETWIVGASLLKHYYSVWDLGGQRLGFADVVGGNSSTSGSNSSSGTSGSNGTQTHASGASTLFGNENTFSKAWSCLALLTLGYLLILV